MAKQAKKSGWRDFSPVSVRRTQRGWLPEKQLAFLDAIAETGCVQQACDHVGMSRDSAYKLRARPDAQGFRMCWDAALDFGVRRLTDAVMSRAIHGEVVPHYYKGELVGEHRRYDNKLAMFVLRYRDPLRYAATLDQMVYTGHPETAAMAFMKARNHAADEAWGVANTEVDDPNPTGIPYTTMPLREAKERADEQAIVEGNGEIHGSVNRRIRLREARAAHHEQKRRAEMSEADLAREKAELERAAEERRLAALDSVSRTFARSIAETANDEERAELRQLEIAERAKLGDPDAVASFLSSLRPPPPRPETAIARATTPPDPAEPAIKPARSGGWRPPPRIRTP